MSIDNASGGESPGSSSGNNAAAAGLLPLRLSRSSAGGGGDEGGTLSVGGVTLFHGVSNAFNSEVTTAHAAPQQQQQQQRRRDRQRRDPPKAVDAIIMGFNTDAAVGEATAGPSSSTGGMRKSRHVVTLATAMPAVARFMACARCKLWWMTPSWGTGVTEVPAETQFLLLELKNNGGYVVLLPMISQDGFRATLSG